jgi:DNA polymerase sigma
MPQGLSNTALLRAYTSIDERVADLGLAIKLWAKGNSLNDASQGTLSSYSWIVMMLHYLQRTEPPVVPFLQTVRPLAFYVSFQYEPACCTWIEAKETDCERMGHILLCVRVARGAGSGLSSSG